MLGIETLDGPVGAAALIGIVLFEAIVLYVGYGALEKLFGPRLARMLRGE
ncbi:DUF7512 family protein [Halapricum desulfuricans]|uniref:Uncharacterized protein n=1 Tax=Halapricum desulfuricans TaxID=2841257 RepID=A0A897NIL7_9EURY|nr:hypothetical protein [Halapricum desulfuricans]QSG10146.1 Uncharacterized protein HSR122_2772 [Halapricum desulfuricans]